MGPRASAPQLLAVALMTLCALLDAEPGIAADDPWIRYENAHFVGYSNAPEKKAHALLGELETFRAAFLQVANLTVPADAPKTTVFVPAGKKEFQELATSKLQAGFAAHDGRRTLIVMPAQGEKAWTRTVIRHEYGHALLRYKKFAYPAWYEEGFAELVSSTELVNNGQSFTIGAPPKRAEENGPPVFPWDVLVSDEFNPHAITDARQGSSAYAQAWLLAHYATLGNDLKNAPHLQAYFDRLKAGEASTHAFEESFDVQVDKLWNERLKPYSKRMPYYTFPYRPGALDPVFVSSVPASGEVEDLLTYLEMHTAASRPPAPPGDVLASVPGRWAPIRIGLACEDYVEFRLGDKPGTITLRPAGDSGRPDSGVEVFKYQLSADGSVRLEPDEGDDGGGILYLRHQTPDLLCMRPGSEPDTGCTRVVHRCGGGNQGGD